MLNRRQLIHASVGGVAAILNQAPQLIAADSQISSLSLHIAVDQLDRESYGNKILALRGCRADAEYYRGRAAESMVVRSKILADDNASIAGVRSFIWHAAKRLRSGSYFLLTFSGYGTRVDDFTSPVDRSHRAWCLHDGLLIEDYLWYLLSQFEPGVRVFVIADTSYGGTQGSDAAAARAMGYAIARNEENADQAEWLERSALNPTLKVLSVLGEKRLPPKMLETALLPRLLTGRQAASAISQRPEEYKTQLAVSQGFENGVSAQASGGWLAACQEDQLAWDVSGKKTGGYMTISIPTVTKGTKQPIRDYFELKTELAARMYSAQTPRLFPFGRDTDPPLEQKPFLVASEQTL